MKAENDIYGEYDGYMNMITDAFKKAGRSNTADDFWSSRYILAAKYMRIDELPALGVDTLGRIFWEQPVSREEAASVMCAACTEVNGEKLRESKGIQKLISDYDNMDIARSKAIKLLVSEGLLAGVDDHYTIAAKKTLTRAEASAIVARINNKSRCLPKPVVPPELQIWDNAQVERDVTYHNPVTGQDETMDVNDWARLEEPPYEGTKDGELSKDGRWKWVNFGDLGMWAALFPQG